MKLLLAAIESLFLGAYESPSLDDLDSNLGEVAKAYFQEDVSFSGADKLSYQTIKSAGLEHLLINILITTQPSDKRFSFPVREQGGVTSETGLRMSYPDKANRYWFMGVQGMVLKKLNFGWLRSHDISLEAMSVLESYPSLKEGLKSEESLFIALLVYFQEYFAMHSHYYFYSWLYMLSFLFEATEGREHVELKVIFQKVDQSLQKIGREVTAKSVFRIIPELVTPVYYDTYRQNFTREGLPLSPTTMLEKNNFLHFFCYFLAVDTSLLFEHAHTLELKKIMNPLVTFSLPTEKLKVQLVTLGRMKDREYQEYNSKQTDYDKADYIFDEYVMRGTHVDLAELLWIITELNDQGLIAAFQHAAIFNQKLLTN